MDLASYLLKPVQRMGKYALLLQDLVREAGRWPTCEPQLAELRAAQDVVRSQLRHGNDLLAMDAVRGCDVSIPGPCSLGKDVPTEGGGEWRGTWSPALEQQLGSRGQPKGVLKPPDARALSGWCLQGRGCVHSPIAVTAVKTSEQGRGHEGPPP